MDLRIRSLYIERERVEWAVAALEEELQQDFQPLRERKSMGAYARKEVSARMKKYWAARRRS
jgi:hypothetical protein